MNQDIKIIRELAKQYAQAANQPNQKRIWQLHANVNDLKQERPIVFISELPWHELNVDNALTLRCQDSDFRQVESFFRHTLFQYRYFPGDMMLQPYYGVGKIINTTGTVTEVRKEIRMTDVNSGIVSRQYENQITSLEDVEAIPFEKITYEKEQSVVRYCKICEAIGDILPVKLVGAPTGYELGYIAWDTIYTIMPGDDMFYNMVDEPELMHALVGRLTDIFLDKIHQYETLNLLEPDSAYCHSTAASSSDLLQNPIDYDHVTRKNVWGRALAQILASVSPKMHDEFDIQYAIKAMKDFGLVYYGCCEPLDQKIDILRKIPNLRKISITPWADIHRAADAISGEYVISAKPNPANLPYAAKNPELIRQELRTLITACRKTNTPCELVLKDISTADYNLENLIVWNRIAMEEVKEG